MTDVRRIRNSRRVLHRVTRGPGENGRNEENAQRKREKQTGCREIVDYSRKTRSIGSILYITKISQILFKFLLKVYSKFAQELFKL